MTTTTTGSSMATSEGSEGESGSGSEGTTGEAIDCRNVLILQQPVLWASGFDGSEDLGFDGLGGLALRRGGDVVVVAADLSETVVASGVAKSYGLRFLHDGRLMVALPQNGKVVTIDGGQAVDYVVDVQTPNGLFADVQGSLWITEFGGDKVTRVTADLERTEIVTGDDAAAANGVVLDAVRGVLFYTKYQAGEVWRVPVDEAGNVGAPKLVVEIPGSSLDGLTMDACGFLYAMDQGGSELYRVFLNAAGDGTIDTQPLAFFPSNVANAQFGNGPGFDEQTLYVSGNPGDVYTLAVGIPGVQWFTL